MKKTIIPFLFLAMAGTQMNAQVGINMPNPGSTLDVNGSFAAQYRAVTAVSYAMNATDFHVAYNGTANAVFTLPTAISGVGNFKGRLYTIKNNTAFTVTVAPAGSETIGASTSISLTPNQGVQIINTGLTGAAATWEVIAQNTASSSGIGCVPDFAFATFAGEQLVAANNNINFNTKVGDGITLSNGSFTLKAGKTYELEAGLFAVNFGGSAPENGVLGANWVNAANNSILSMTTSAEFYPVTYSVTRNSIMPITRSIITPTTDMTVAVRITSSNGYAYIRGEESYAMVHQLNSCGGGGGVTTTPGTTYNGSTSVVLNGNSFERAALGGDVAATSNSNTVNVTGLQGRSLAATAPVAGDLMSYDGTKWVPLPSSALGIPKQVISVSVPEGGTQNIQSAGSIQFAIKNYDPNNSWVNNEYIVPTGFGGTYNLNVQVSNEHVASANPGNFWVMMHVQKSTDGGANYTRVGSEIRTSSGGDFDNSIGTFWTGNLNAGDRLRVIIFSSADTANYIRRGNLALTRL